MVLPNRRNYLRTAISVFIAFYTISPMPAAHAIDIARQAAAAEQAIRLGNFERAGRLLIGLAKAGHARSQYRLAAMYRSGRGVKADQSKALMWITAAAKGGDAQAVAALERMLAKDVKVRSKTAGWAVDVRVINSRFYILVVLSQQLRRADRPGGTWGSHKAGQHHPPTHAITYQL